MGGSKGEGEEGGWQSTERAQWKRWCSIRAAEGERAWLVEVEGRIGHSW